MKTKITCALVLLFGMTGIEPTQAEFIYVESELVSCDDCLKVWRAYAVFNQPTDQLLAIFGDDDFPVELTSFGIPVVLYNDGGVFDGLKAEDFAGAPFSGPSDSWLTIGHDSFIGNDTDYSPGFLGGDGVHRALETVFSDSSGGWYDTDPSTPALPDASGRILIGQFTFQGDPGVFFRGRVAWQPAPGALMEDQFDTFLSNPKDLCPWDQDFDFVITFKDVVSLLSAWGPCPECCPADLNADGMVGMEDLIEMLQVFGYSC
jgi:hypothetical protein